MRVNGHDHSIDIERTRSALRAIPVPSGRDEWWRLVASAQAAGLDKEEIRSWCESGPGYNAHDFEDTYRSLTPGKGYTERTLFKSAIDAGWRDEDRRPTSTDFSPAPAPIPAAGAAHDHDMSHTIAEDYWRACAPATGSNEYIQRKGGQPDGLREKADGTLAKPLFNLDGELVDVQRIKGTDKRFLNGIRISAFPDAHFPVGPSLHQAKVAYLVEGIGQAWSIHKATGGTAIDCSGVGRVAGVAKALREQFPDLCIVIVSDAGQEALCAKVAAEVGGSWVEMPKGSPKNFDVNDMEQRDGLGAVAKLLASPTTPAAEPGAWSMPAAIDDSEWMQARPTPDCIVQDYLFADVGILIAPGATGKTTLLLFEAIHIVLALPLYGLEIRRPGPVLILTAEDSREMLVARLRSIAGEMDLTDEQIRQVMAGVRISDVSGAGFKLTEVFADVVTPATTIDQIIAGCGQLRPVMIVIDPAVSFGVGESRVNDAEQGLVEAARKLRRALNCCVRYVHHSGKQNARERTVDQYSGRGGSSFADGARMVAVLQNMTADEWLEATGQELEDGDTGLRLARPKISYAPPAGDIFIRRSGYEFQRVNSASNGMAALLEANASMLWRLLESELKEGRRHSKNSLESVCELRRAELRKSVSWLEASGRIEDRAIPNRAGGRGGNYRYLHPIASPNQLGEPKANHDE